MHKIFILFHTPTQTWRMFSREKIELYLPYFAQIFLDSPVPLKQNLNRKIIFIKQFIKYFMKKKHHKISTIINYFVRWTYEEIGKCLAYPLEHPPWAKRGVKDRRPNPIRIHNKNNENCICCILLFYCTCYKTLNILFPVPLINMIIPSHRHLPTYILLVATRT